MAHPIKPTEAERAAKPGKYWFHNYGGRAEFLWGEWDVSEEEFRRNVDADNLAMVDAALGKPK
jgi:hypothetical protein